METNIIHNEHCFETMNKMLDKSVDVVLTSPFYNTNKKTVGKTLLDLNLKKGAYSYLRYDVFVDNMTNDEYNDFSVELFNNFDRVLKKDGVVLYNISYGCENPNGMFLAINSIISNTNFSIADVIGWKKTCAMPNNVSPNKLTRIWEFVFVLCRDTESKSFHCNKQVKSVRKTGQKVYENIFNYIEAKNNDGSCPYNKATYSSSLCEQLLRIYAPNNGVVYDPFMGSGTTAVACKRLNLRYIGSEISPNQCTYAKERLANVIPQLI